MKKILLIGAFVGFVFPLLTSAAVPSVPIHFTVMTQDATLFDGDIVVDECLDSELGTSTSVHAFCAIEQVASSSSWTIGTTWYPFGHSLDSINSYTPDFANNRYWIYYADRAPGLSALNAHQLVPNQELLLLYGINPLRIVPATTTPLVGATTTLVGQYFDPMLFDWVSATGTTFTINGEATSSDEFGVFTFTPSTTTPYVVTLSRAGALTSTPLTLAPYVVIESATTAPEPSGTVGSVSPEVTHVIDVVRAVNYLRTASDGDGLYGPELYNDWVAIGISGISDAADIRAKLIAHAKNHTDVGVLLTDLERRSMALLALGVDPRTGTSRDYIADMFTNYENGMWGDRTEVNDDIFALFPLLAVGYTADDAVIKNTTQTIIALQLPSGSWGSIDLTAAGIQALAPLSALSGVTESIQRALTYLHQNQGEDGGFGTSFATSWVIQALVSLQSGDIALDWKKNGKTPQDYLWLLQQIDGGIELMTLDKNLRIWATAYAIPAANGKNWYQLLGAYPRSISDTQSVGSGGEVLGASTTQATIALATATTTLVASTTTVAMPPASTSTPIISSPSPATSTPIEKIIKQEKRTPVKVSPKKNLEASVIQATQLITVVAKEETPSFWKKIILAPFTRLFQALRGWLP